MRGCNGICSRYKTKHPVRKDWYATGIKHCGACEVNIDWDGWTCPCCKSRLRTNTKEKKSNDDKRY